LLLITTLKGVCKYYTPLKQRQFWDSAYLWIASFIKKWPCLPTGRLNA
jgi:hypothetical protein